jgi:hypothetical protein
MTQLPSQAAKRHHPPEGRRAFPVLARRNVLRRMAIPVSPRAGSRQGPLGSATLGATRETSKLLRQFRDDERENSRQGKSSGRRAGSPTWRRRSTIDSAGTWSRRTRAGSARQRTCSSEAFGIGKTGGSRIAQAPFPEHAGPVSGLLENFRHGNVAGSQRDFGMRISTNPGKSAGSS